MHCCGHSDTPILLGDWSLTHYDIQKWKTKLIKWSDIPIQIHPGPFPSDWKHDQHTSRITNEAHTELNSSGAFI